MVGLKHVCVDVRWIIKFPCASDLHHMYFLTHLFKCTECFSESRGFPRHFLLCVCSWLFAGKEGRVSLFIYFPQEFTKFSLSSPRATFRDYSIKIVSVVKKCSKYPPVPHTIDCRPPFCYPYNLRSHHNIMFNTIADVCR